MAREQFTFHRIYFETVKHLKKADQLAVLTAIMEYALDGQEPELEDMAGAVFRMVKRDIDIRAKMSEGGRRGGKKTQENRADPSKGALKGASKGASKEAFKHPSPEREKESSPPSPPSPSPASPPSPPYNPPSEKEREGARGAHTTRPTREEIRLYCLERGKGVDPDRFFDFYTANGWKVGKNPMKDWRAAVRTWERDGTRQTPINPFMREEVHL